MYMIFLYNKYLVLLASFKIDLDLNLISNFLQLQRGFGVVMSLYNKKLFNVTITFKSFKCFFA